MPICVKRDSTAPVPVIGIGMFCLLKKLFYCAGVIVSINMHEQTIQIITECSRAHLPRVNCLAYGHLKLPQLCVTEQVCLFVLCKSVVV
jgi:hypothetical protein